MKRDSIFIALITVFLGIQINTVIGQTYCNPLNLTYGFNSDQSLSHKIANPSVVLYKDKYFLFASNAGGYWYSNDLLSWKYVTTNDLQLKNQSPTVTVIGDWLYFFASKNDTIFRSNNPVGGKWEVYNSRSLLLSLLSDFSVFVDTDGRVYCYYGCSNNDGVMTRELDPNNFLNPIGIPMVCEKANLLEKVHNTVKNSSSKTGSPEVQGSWMNKYNGKYYYQCAELNADLGNYSDVVYVSDSPLGPFTFAANNPFSYRPDGFVCGAGNGSTFTDKYGNWWHITTITAPSNHDSQSSLGLFPTGFDKDGNLFTKTDFGDYPITIPTQKYNNIDKLGPEWALLSDSKKAEASSSLATSPVNFAFDENSGSYWSAKSGEKGEWLGVDLGSVCTINAFQVNFAWNKSQNKGSNSVFAYQYLVQYSIDKKNWKTLSDKTSNTECQTNPYEALKIPVQAQYIKITNYHVPDGTFAISGFRIFGLGSNRKPPKVSSFRTIRDFHNPQIVKLFWVKQDNTNGYNIRYGTDVNKLYHSYQVFKKNRLTIRCPDRKKAYWFEIDAFNENGVTPGKPLRSH